MPCRFGDCKGDLRFQDRRGKECCASYIQGDIEVGQRGGMYWRVDENDRKRYLSKAQKCRVVNGVPPQGARWNCDDRPGAPAGDVPGFPGDASAQRRRVRIADALEGGTVSRPPAVRAQRSRRRRPAAAREVRERAAAPAPSRSAAATTIQRAARAKQARRAATLSAKIVRMRAAHPAPAEVQIDPDVLDMEVMHAEAAERRGRRAASAGVLQRAVRSHAARRSRTSARAVKAAALHASLQQSGRLGELTRAPTDNATFHFEILERSKEVGAIVAYSKTIGNMRVSDSDICHGKFEGERRAYVESADVLFIAKQSARAKTVLAMATMKHTNRDRATSEIELLCAKGGLRLGRSIWARIRHYASMVPSITRIYLHALPEVVHFYQKLGFFFVAKPRGRRSMGEHVKEAQRVPAFEALGLAMTTPPKDMNRPSPAWTAATKALAVATGNGATFRDEGEYTVTMVFIIRSPPALGSRRRR